MASATEHLLPVGDVTEIDDDPQAEARYASPIDQSSLAATDERCCRALMRVAHECKRFAQVPLLIHLTPVAQKSSMEKASREILPGS